MSKTVLTQTQVTRRMAELISAWGEKIDGADFDDDKAAGRALGRIVIEIYTLVQASVIADYHEIRQDRVPGRGPAVRAATRVCAQSEDHPMIKIEFDYSELQAYAKSFGATVDQIPFALALAMNRSADVTRNYLIKQTWPTHVRQRNSSFIAASLTTRDARASKQSLAVEIYDKLDRGNLQMQAKGGTRVPHGGSMLAVPASSVPKGSRGVPQRLRPKSLRNAFKKGDVLYTKDKRGRMKLMYVLKPATKIPKRVPFYEDFAASMERELRRTIPLAVARAMATRRT